LNISEYEIQDLLECARHRTKSFWLNNIKSAYSDSTIDDPIIKEFKFFTVWPGNIYFYIDGDKIEKEPVVVKSREFDDTFKVNSDRMILLSVYDRSGKKVIRYAETPYDILA